MNNDIKIVLFNRYTEQLDCSAVFCENYLAAKEVGNYLIDSGHRNMGFISGELDRKQLLIKQNKFETIVG